MAPTWTCSDWLNAEEPLSPETLRGRVIVAAAFQMLCPGCVAQTIPQLVKVRALFPPETVAVVGLHTVFEHHAAMGLESLRAFLHEYRVTFPVGVDRHEPGKPIPLTMAAYSMQGTPTLILIDRQGMLRRQTFGHVPDLQLGAEIMALIAEREPLAETGQSADEQTCKVGADRC
jgi:hypothetical protein